MSGINGLYVASNPTALTAQFNLTRNMSELATTLTRLSTGLRINTAKDDPAGLIASELLKSDIAGTNQAITNIQRANGMLSTADSAMANIGTLLTDIKSLVVGAANTGAMNKDQINANQLQVNATLEAIDQIAMSTTYGGQKILDGSMDFQTDICGGTTDGISNLSITSANFGTSDKIDVDVKIQQAAKRGTLIYQGTGVEQKTTFDVTGSTGTKTITVGNDGQFTSNEEIAKAINAVSDSTGVQARVEGGKQRGSIILSSVGKDNDIVITALKEGVEFGDYDFKIVSGAATAVALDSGTNTVTITIAQGATAADVITAINNACESGNTGEVSGMTGLFNASALKGDGTSGLVMAQDSSAIYGSLNLDNAIRFTGMASSSGSGAAPIIRIVKGNYGDELSASLVPPTDEDLRNGIASGQAILEIRLKVDANGNSITTAKQLADFFDTLESSGQTGGISAELVYPPGVDPNGRTWVTDNCGNQTMVEDCSANYGNGIVDPTRKETTCGAEENDIWLMGSNQQLYTKRAELNLSGASGGFTDLTIMGREKGTGVAGTEIVITVSTDKLVENKDANGNNISGSYANAINAIYNKELDKLTIYLASGATVTEQDLKNYINNTGGIREYFYASGAGTATLNIPSGADVGYNLGKLTDSWVVDIDRDSVYSGDVAMSGGISMLGASDSSSRLILEATEYGSDNFVKVAVREGSFRTFCPMGLEMCYLAGTDVVGTINGFSATGRGTTLALDNADLSLSFDTNNEVGDTSFSITGGGALFQIGPDVVSAQQKRLGIPSMMTTNIGGVSGKLFQLKTGGDADLVTSDASRKLADKIVNESISFVANARGRIGAVQKSLFDPMINVLQDQLVSLTDAQGSIANADFAEESSNLTQLQLLLQSGMATLGIANSLPQYAASLVR